MAILSLMFLLLGPALSSAMDTGTTVTSTGLVRSHAERMVQQIARDIRYSSVSSDGWVFPALTQNTSISFSRCTGWDPATQQLTWGPIITYEWLIDATGGEVEDGVDNNRNGLIDEGMLYHQQGGSARASIGRNIERASLLLWLEETADGDVVTIRLGSARPNPAHPDSVARATYETVVSLRNE